MHRKSHSLFGDIASEETYFGEFILENLQPLYMGLTYVSFAIADRLVARRHFRVARARGFSGKVSFVV
jgi:hypothetical protein